MVEDGGLPASLRIERHDELGSRIATGLVLAHAGGCSQALERRIQLLLREPRTRLQHIVVERSLAIDHRPEQLIDAAAQTHPRVCQLVLGRRPKHGAVAEPTREHEPALDQVAHDPAHQGVLVAVKAFEQLAPGHHAVLADVAQHRLP